MARRSSTTASPPAKPPGQPDRNRVIYGPEEMLKRECLDELRGSLEAAYGAFDAYTYDGKAAPLADVLDELRSYSLMQQYKLVIVDDADVFVAAHREALERYAQAPVDTATLVLRATKWNKGNLDKSIAKVGDIKKCEAMSPGDARAWLLKRAREAHAVRLEPKAAQFLADRLGGNLMQLDQELGKLAVLAGPGVAITVDLVEQVVGRSSDEEAWAVQEAVLEVLANPSPALPVSGASGPGGIVEKVHELVDLAGQPDVLVAYFIADLIRKLYTGAMMKREGASDYQISSEFKLWGRRQATFMQVLGRVKPETIGRLFDRVVELDVRAKTGRGDSMRNIECFCAVLAEGVR